MPSQHTAVATAEGITSPRGILPPKWSPRENHQKAVSAARPINESRSGPPAWCRDGPGPAGKPNRTVIVDDRAIHRHLATRKRAWGKECRDQM
jgi:hypothetical protein